MKLNEIDPRKFIKVALLQRTSLLPSLLIGEYVDIFKQEFTGSILRCYSLKNVRYITEEYEGVTNVNSGILVLEGIGNLSTTGQNSMLKFIEESKVPIILLSYTDSVINTVRSRMKLVLKRWKPVKHLDFISLKSCLSTIEEKKAKDKNFKGVNEVQFLADNCPDYYGLVCSKGNAYGDNYFTDRMIEVICKQKEETDG